MRWIVLIACLLLLGACSSNEITGKVLAADGVNEAKAPEAKAANIAAKDLEESKPQQYADVTEVKTYDLKGECQRDSQGVVRFFDEAGKKTVYRNECVGNFLIKYTCDGSQVVSDNTVCNGVCTPGIYGATCK